MSIYLGNLSAKEMCERLGIECTEQIADMELARERKADVKSGTDKWHCFDIPFEVVCGTRQMKQPIRFSVVPPERKEE